MWSHLRLLLLGWLEGSSQHRDLGHGHEEEGTVYDVRVLSPVPACLFLPGGFYPGTESLPMGPWVRSHRESAALLSRWGVASKNKRMEVCKCVCKWVPYDASAWSQ